jgi:ATPase subunit of ABC transporter with duplicated ATPase domains
VSGGRSIVQNGAGKTTLCNTICGFVRPDSGSLTFERNPVGLRATDNAETTGTTRCPSKVDTATGRERAPGASGHRFAIDARTRPLS